MNIEDFSKATPEAANDDVASALFDAAYHRPGQVGPDHGGPGHIGPGHFGHHDHNNRFGHDHDDHRRRRDRARDRNECPPGSVIKRIPWPPHCAPR